jgi:hypothetical protein
MTGEPTPLETVAVPRGPALDTSPMAEVRHADVTIDVEADDLDGRRVVLRFFPYQALRVTSIDCVPSEIDSSILRSRQVLEVVNSAWIRELAEALAGRDETATFLDRAHHFLIPAQDRIVEVAAWTMQVLDKAEAGPTAGPRQVDDAQMP